MRRLSALRNNKPRLFRLTVNQWSSPRYAWACEGREAICTGPTKEEAYAQWRRCMQATATHIYAMRQFAVDSLNDNMRAMSKPPFSDVRNA